jgi:hypothetical protein
MAYYQTSYQDDDPETLRRMRALAGLDPDPGAPPPAQLQAPPNQFQQPPAELPTATLQPPAAPPDEHPTDRAMRILAGRDTPPARELTDRERQADRSAIDAEGEAKFGSAVNDLGVLAALVADIAGNRGRGIGKLGGAWAAGKVQAADRDRVLAQRNRERAQDSADKTQERSEAYAHADATQGRDIASREALTREGQDATTSRTQMQIDAAAAADTARLTSAEKREAAQLAEQHRVNDANISNLSADNTEQYRHNVEGEKNARWIASINAQARKDAADARAEENQHRRDDKQEQRDILHRPIPGMETHDQSAYEAATMTPGMREKAIEARSVIGATADAMHDMVDIRTKIGVGNPQTDAKEINRFQQAQSRFMGGLGAMSGMGGVLSDKERAKLESMASSITFGGRDALDAMASLAGYGNPNQDTQLEKMKGALEDVTARVNARLAPIGTHYVRMKLNYDEPPEDKKTEKTEPKKVGVWKPGTYAPNTGGY